MASCGRLAIGLCSSGENSPFLLPLTLRDDFHRRRLPHFHAIGRPLFLTWRLHGSLPPNRSLPPASTSGRAFVATDRLLDQAYNHLVRDEAEFRRIVNYIELNPVK
jgi:hypothetical protein